MPLLAAQSCLQNFSCLLHGRACECGHVGCKAALSVASRTCALAKPVMLWVLWAAAFQAGYKLTRRWSMLVIWSLHIHTCISAVSSIYLCLCVVLSLATSSVMLNAFTSWNNARDSGKVACFYAAQSLFPSNSPVVSLVSTS